MKARVVKQMDGGKRAFCRGNRVDSNKLEMMSHPHRLQQKCQSEGESGSILQQMNEE